MSSLSDLRRAQAGVVSRAQVLAAGRSSRDVERMLRRRELTRVHTGVYVDHTGPLTWEQRAWAACLAHAPAALTGASALRVWAVRTGAATDDDPVELVVAAARRVRDPDGVRTRRSASFDTDALVHLDPPRTRLEPALLEVASAALREDRCVAVLADAVQAGRTTTERLRSALDQQTRLRRRGLMGEVLADASAGALSPLERRYLRDVERRHRLPAGERQARRDLAASGRSAYDDVRYAAYGVVVELDGLATHGRSVDRWADLERDLEVAGAGEVSLRVGWRQVLDPCRLARLVSAVLAARGWTGELTCVSGACSAPGAEDAPLSA